jgi:hypothetical protein
MDANIKFIIYYNNIKDDSLSKTYIYNDLKTKIIDIKKEIFNDFPKEGFNYVDIDYVSERIYKEIGKYSFNYGIFPRTMDNTRLSNYTDGNKTFHFFIHYSNNEVIVNNENNRRINLSFIKKEEDENDIKQPIQQETNLFDSNNYEKNFPPLGKMK